MSYQDMIGTESTGGKIIGGVLAVLFFIGLFVWIGGNV